jgi:hypothetical protein
MAVRQQVSAGSSVSAARSRSKPQYEPRSDGHADPLAHLVLESARGGGHQLAGRTVDQQHRRGVDVEDLADPLEQLVQQILNGEMDQGHIGDGLDASQLFGRRAACTAPHEPHVANTSPSSVLRRLRRQAAQPRGEHADRRLRVAARSPIETPWPRASSAARRGSTRTGVCHPRCPSAGQLSALPQPRGVGRGPRSGSGAWAGARHPSTTNGMAPTGQSRRRSGTSQHWTPRAVRAGPVP